MSDRTHNYIATVCLPFAQDPAKAFNGHMYGSIKQLNAVRLSGFANAVGYQLTN
jgi:hypothetical protein